MKDIEIPDLEKRFGFRSIGSQALQFGVSLLFGAVVILIYTGYTWLFRRFFRNRLKSRIILFFADISFWLIASVFAFMMYYRLDGADIRPYCFIWIFTGMAAAYNIKLFILKKRRKEPQKNENE